MNIKPDSEFSLPAGKAGIQNSDTRKGFTPLPNAPTVRSWVTGFTLIESLIYLGILSTFLIILAEIFTSSLAVQLSSQATSSVALDGQYILSRLNYDLTRAQVIVQPANPGDIGNTLALTIGGITHTYTLNGNNLTLTAAAGTNQLNGFDTTVSNLTFARLGNSGGKPAISIDFTLTAITVPRSGLEMRSFHTTIGRR